MRLIDADKLSLRFLSNVQDTSNFNVRRIIDTQPTEDAKMVVHGKWLLIGQSIICSICDSSNNCRSTYCPSCGALNGIKGDN